MSETIISLTELIALGKNNKLSLPNISRSNAEGILRPIYLDYLPYLKSEAITVELTDEEYYKYRFRPRKLAEYLYDDSEYFHILMILNNISSFARFDKQKLLIMPLDSTLIFDIIKNERKNLQRYPPINE